jgi:hypothetical protein
MFYLCSVLLIGRTQQMTSNLNMALAALALSGCAPGARPDNASAAGGEQLALKTTTALSLAEHAYNSGEAAATAAVRSGALTPAEDQAIGDAVHRARTYRDEARMIVSAGGDASAAIESLDDSLRRVATLAQPAQQ